MILLNAQLMPRNAECGLAKARIFLAFKGVREGPRVMVKRPAGAWRDAKWSRYAQCRTAASFA